MTSVLIVDDEPNMRKTLRDILADRGYEVSTAASGERAVDMCSRRDYDVVLMDVRMPGIDGVEAMRRILRGNDRVRVLMMSAYSLEHLQERAMREGAGAFLRKPLDASEVIRWIGQGSPCG